MSRYVHVTSRAFVSVNIDLWCEQMAQEMDANLTFVTPSFKTRSEIWTYFGFMADSDGVVADKKKIACHICRAIIAYSGNTSNITYQLERLHSSEFRKYLKKTGKGGKSSEEDMVVDNGEYNQTEAQPEPKQLTLDAAYKRTAPFLQNSPRYCSLLRATSNFIFHTMQPLSLVDEPAFRNLLQVAEPRFQLPHRTHITMKVLPEAYSGVRTAVEKQLAMVSKCTITTDLWTSQHQQRSYMSLTVHFIADNFTLQSKCLQTLEVPQDHDAASLKDVLSSMFSDWKITD